MTNAKVDITGQKIGRWLVLERIVSGVTYYRCVCECGTERLVRQDTLRAQGKRKSRSCGCLRREIASETAKLVNSRRAA